MRNDTDGLGGTRRLECEEIIGQRRPRVSLDRRARRRGGSDRGGTDDGKDDQFS
jgi:hypothetical protein